MSFMLYYVYGKDKKIARLSIIKIIGIVLYKEQIQWSNNALTDIGHKN